jgi:UDP-GlcNAc:undecaprenyl-phosphate/decaprenyl-phosphate GlcNAc-1-phosphate transferase
MTHDVPALAKTRCAGIAPPARGKAAARRLVATIPAMSGAPSGIIAPILALLAVGFVIAWPLTALLVRLGERLGALDTPGAGGHVKRLRAVPNIGGIAIFAAIALPLAAGLLALQGVDERALSRWLPAVAPHLERVRATAPTAWALLAGMAALHVLGLVDDRRGLGPWIKLGVQAAVAIAIAAWFDVRLLTALDAWLPWAGQFPSIAATVLWIVIVTNAINFLDNMDGLAGGVAAIAGGLFMAATIVNAQWFIAGTLALMVGALVGFLIYNFPAGPRNGARIFMGDGGSLVIGFLLAVLTARTTYFDPAQEDYALGGGWYGVFMPVIVLAIPLYDFLSVTVIRLRQGRSPFVGDQQHFSHRLVARGLSQRSAVLVIWAATAVTGIGGISLGRLQPWQAVLVGVQTLLVLGTIALFEHSSRTVRDEAVRR